MERTITILQMQPQVKYTKCTLLFFKLQAFYGPNEVPGVNINVLLGYFCSEPGQLCNPKTTT